MQFFPQTIEQMFAHIIDKELPQPVLLDLWIGCGIAQLFA